jgi:uncharacterized repeat protein (TIGR01451 family)
MVGTVMTYTIQVGNYGAVPATGVELTDLLDPDTTYTGGALANHGTLDDSVGAMGVITWTGNVTYAEPLMLTIPVAATGGCGVVTNTAIVTHTSLGAELQDAAATALYSEPMEVDKSGPFTATTGSVVEMQIVLSSTVYAPGTVVTDAIPVGMEYAGNLQASDGVAWYDLGDDAVYWTTAVPILQMPGITITFDVTVTAGSGEVVNTVEAEYCDSTTGDSHTIVVWPSCNPVTGADFDYSPSEPEVDETVVFTGTVDEGTLVLPVTYIWDFGDGGTAMGVNATHTFSQSGDYTVWMTATNCGGAGVSVVSHTVTVQAVCEPVTGADFDYSPTELLEDEMIYFTGTVASGDAPIIYTWAFDDGVTATGVNVTHTFSQSGDYTVWMTATNCGGMGVSVVSRTVMVEAACESVTDASFDYAPSEPVEDEVITFSAIYTPANATSATLTYSWDFGAALKSGDSVTYTYAATGTYGITLTVANACTVPPVEYVGYVTVAERIVYVYLPLVVKNYD